MYNHSCREAGATGCGYRMKAGSDEELRSKLSEHTRKVHRVPTLTDTIYNYLRNTAGRG